MTSRKDDTSRKVFEVDNSGTPKNQKVNKQALREKLYTTRHRGEKADTSYIGELPYNENLHERSWYTTRLLPYNLKITRKHAMVIYMVQPTLVTLWLTRLADITWEEGEVARGSGK